MNKTKAVALLVVESVTSYYLLHTIHLDATLDPFHKMCNRDHHHRVGQARPEQQLHPPPRKIDEHYLSADIIQ